ncbi:MAG: MerR family transcriptional regulator, partial [Chloroflexota bacterium]|nr:MerR family transcriptional regulator [Chloroflexota bacterium]
MGDVAARVGVSTATLRAWERRYGAFRPQRTTGGHRTYTGEDLARITALVALINTGARPSRAVRLLEMQAAAAEPVDALAQELW